MFPTAKNHNDGALKELSWDDFFEKFDKNGLELLYQDVTKEGAESNFNKLIYPENDKTSSKKTPDTSHSKSHATAKKKAS